MEDRAREVFDAARKIFCDGIYVKSSAHRCGWDFLDFEWVTERELDEYEFSAEDFNENYSTHDLEGLTLAQILEKVGDDGWCFEISQVDELK